MHPLYTYEHTYTIHWDGLLAAATTNRHVCVSEVLCFQLVDSSSCRLYSPYRTVTSKWHIPRHSHSKLLMLFFCANGKPYLEAVLSPRCLFFYLVFATTVPGIQWLCVWENEPLAQRHRAHRTEVGVELKKLGTCLNRHWLRIRGFLLTFIYIGPIASIKLIFFLRKY